MNIEYRLFPYPVLNYFSDDYKNSTFSSTLEVEKGLNSIILEVTATTDDEGLNNLITNNLAEYVFHM